MSPRWTRRWFFQRLGAAALGLTLSRVLPGIAPREDASLGVDDERLLLDTGLGMTIRLVRQYDVQSDSFPVRLDVLYGCSVVKRDMGAAVIRWVDGA